MKRIKTRSPVAWKWIFFAAFIVLVAAAWFTLASLDFAEIEEVWETLTVPQAIIIAAIFLALFSTGRAAR